MERIERQLRDHFDELDEAEAQAVLDEETAVDEDDYWNEFDDLDTSTTPTSDLDDTLPTDNTFSAQTHEAANKFEEELKSVRYTDCELCCEKFWTFKEDSTKYNHCQRSPLKGRKYLADNDMDPGNVVPDCLKDLTDIEEQLISLTRPVIQVRYVKGGQIRYQDHISNFVQHVEELPPQLNNLPQQLPRRPRDLNIVIIRHSGVDLARQIDFKVRKTHIQDALHR
ncbi:hypothetical protein SISSUDRAFT_1061732 [Sistotremastrum suecicum HHB10207 ss-3]|uniref:DUF6570 domain-containing protein n=1 Tax=Sistotremastrum suecicum HHB10207 ss-3 TaxID=1314776 RepID=A0A166DML3_9AGAM|nr:hypothetical protein SISSUDRAFT_1061732 [Sistotremastrum suecicum HHB10207 ss-3]